MENLIVPNPKTVEELQEKAAIYWPSEIAKQEKSSSIIPLLLKTQDSFISVLHLASKDPYDWAKILDFVEDLYPNLFLKHLCILSDIGGENLKRFSADLPNKFKCEDFRFNFRGKNYDSKMESLFSGKKWSNSSLGRDISYDNGTEPRAILSRLKDLFGHEPYRELIYCDVRNFLTCSNKRKFHSSNGIINNPGESRLLNGDCLDVIKTIPENSVDFIFADPPYNIKKKYDNWNDAQDISNYFSWCDQWIAESARVLKPGRTFAIINIPLWIVRHFSFAKSILDYQDWIVWEGLSLPVRKIMPAHYGIICFSKGRPIEIANHEKKASWTTPQDFMSLKPWYCVRTSCIKKRNINKITDRQPIGNLWWDIHRLKHNSKRVDHPCQLPPSLMKRLIHTFTKVGDLVLDPFNGAGTTTLTSEMLGRKFIGIELSNKYHAIAEQRHLDLQKGRDPFAKNGTTPKAKNSRVARLQKQKYEVPKKTLQIEVKKIAIKLERRPTREDIIRLSKYPIRYFDEYFIDWGEVCSAVGDKGMTENFSQSISTQPDDQQMELSFR